MTLRIGLGIDLHRLEAGRPCVLGGVEIASPVGPMGHSDGDAVLHAICDAVLGAAGLEDLGTLFPDTDPAFAGKESSVFCTAAQDRLRAAGFAVESLDVVVETEQPKLKPHRDRMRAHIAGLFGLTVGQVNIKGKTGEKCDSIGRGEALRATAVALLRGTEQT